MDTIDARALYTPAEVAALLRCGKSNVYNILGAGDLAVIRIGAHRSGFRVLGSDLLSFLESRKEGGPRPRMAFKRLGRRAD